MEVSLKTASGIKLVASISSYNQMAQNTTVCLQCWMLYGLGNGSVNRCALDKLEFPITNYGPISYFVVLIWL